MKRKIRGILTDVIPLIDGHLKTCNQIVPIVKQEILNLCNNQSTHDH